jgi:NAD-dependent deacetylase
LSPVDRLVELLRASRRVLIFTGAGISTGSGIPDFRGPQGTWKSRRPVYFQDFLSSEESRVEHWDYKMEFHERFRDARPNAAHRALVDLERLGRLEALVTQNIDGLHEAAGNSPEKIVELHGTNRWVVCLTCGARSDPEPHFVEFRKTGRCPTCACGGWLKSATVSFGQAMPEREMARAAEAAGRCDLAISIGSTLEVHPAASIPMLAAERGVPYAIVNQGPTAQDGCATVRVEGDAVEILPAVVGLVPPGSAR